MDNLRAVLSIIVLLLVSCSATQVSHDGRALLIDGVRAIIISGSIHYPRSTPEMWPDLIEKAREGGLNAIDTYVFWDVHEPRPREYNFKAGLDLIRFIKTIQDAGLYTILRIGPYVCAEWSYGGLPVWLHQIPGIKIRTDNKIFKKEMKTFVSLIVDMVKRENLLAPQGGPIILTQIENEYGNVMGSYGDEGKRYVKWCAELAVSLNVSVPWIMCQQADAPKPMINTCNGYYCDQFKPNNPNSPKMWTENWTGWFKGWGGSDPHRPVEDIAFAVARFFQLDGTLQNYYMYHGGTNFGRSTGGPYISTSYDYDAPLDEYGNIRQPKWGHLKQLHSTLYSIEKYLTYGKASSTMLGDMLGDGHLWVTEYALNGTSACFMSNTNDKKDETVSFNNKTYFLPSWSVSILPDCKNVVYNTATVGTQTEVTVQKLNMDEGPKDLKWLWKDEHIKPSTFGWDSNFTVNELLEQNSVTGATSDYLWYTTSFRITKDDPMYAKKMILSVKTNGHILHAYFNGKLVGSDYGKNGHYGFVLEAPIEVLPTKNFIALLSVTNGLKNYDAFYDTAPTGIVGGPVKLIGNGNLTKYLSKNAWNYKVGLSGEENEIWTNKNVDWEYDTLTIRRPMTWYKTTFKAPLGDNAVVVDLQGLQKGAAWVNGNSIGRYWSSFLAKNDCKECDYNGNFFSNKCTTGCGEPTQRWYHVPRSFLNTDDNTLVLFEEFGGSPLNVHFRTVVVKNICASGSEGDVLELKCPNGRKFSKIDFAYYGDARGTCGTYLQYKKPNKDALSLVKMRCLHKNSCSITPPSQCRLTVQATC